jgi:hypothetical protein
VHRRDNIEPRGRFGLPPEHPARRAPLSPLRAFVILASAGLIAWLLAAGGSTESPGDAPTDPARAPSVSGVSRSPVERVESPPTAEEALAAFTTLDRLRATTTEAGAERVLTPGLSLRRLARAVPPGGRTRHVEVLSLETDRVRIRQVIELSSWDIDLGSRDLSVGRTARRLGVEWTLTRMGSGWRITGWQVVEDRALVGGR